MRKDCLDFIKWGCVALFFGFSAYVHLRPDNRSLFDSWYSQPLYDRNRRYEPIQPTRSDSLLADSLMHAYNEEHFPTASARIPENLEGERAFSGTEPYRVRSVVRKAGDSYETTTVFWLGNDSLTVRSPHVAVLPFGATTSSRGDSLGFASSAIVFDSAGAPADTGSYLIRLRGLEIIDQGIADKY